MLRRLAISLNVAFVAVSFAKGMGIPWLEHGAYGDQVDIGIATILAVWFLTGDKESGDEP